MNKSKRILSLLLCFALSCTLLSIFSSIQVSAAAYTWPVSTDYGITNGFYAYENHNGCDMACPIGTPVYAVADGTVTTAMDRGCLGSHRSGGTPQCSRGSSCDAWKNNGNNGSFGNYIYITHANGVVTRYCHLRTGFAISSGQSVSQGQLIGYSGAAGNTTGPHLHFEFRVNGTAKNPADYLTRTNNVIPNDFPGAEDTSWNVPVWKSANYKLNTYDSYGNQESNRWIDAGDNCYVEKVYQNGYAWVKYPSSASSDGYRWAFTRAEGFSLEKKGNGFPGAEDTSWKVPVWKTANYQLNTYDSNGSQESNRWIDQGDNCYIEKVYQNGYAWVKYPSTASSDGYRWAYTRAEGFSLEKNNWHSGLSAANVGSDFYAYIINTQAWKHLTNDKDNVSMRTETGNANQVWKFDRQGDGSYKITNTDDGKVLDVYGAGTSDGTNVQVYSSNDSAAQRWFIYGESGAYFLRAACGDLVLDINGGSTADGTNVQMWTKNDSGAQKFQIWKLNKPGSTHVNCNIGTTFTPTVFSWNATSDTTEYDLKIWKGTVWEGDAYKILWSEKGTSVSVNLPEGYYEAYVDSRNKYSITMSDNVVKFTVSHGTSYVFSDSFNACISKGDYCLGATEDGNVTLQTKNNGDNQKWKFELQEDNAYRITNIKYNKCLDVYNYDTANGTNIQIWTPNDSNAQFFYIRQNSNGYSLIPKCSLGSAVDITDNVIGNGTNIQEWSYQGDNKQIFDIEIAPSVSPGDINGDKKVNMKDLVLLQQYLNNWDVTINEKAANVNGDEKINMKDLVLLQQYLNNWDVELK